MHNPYSYLPSLLDVELSFVQASYTVTEGSQLTVELTITNPQTESVTVTVASSDGTAIG